MLRRRRSQDAYSKREFFRLNELGELYNLLQAFLRHNESEVDDFLKVSGRRVRDDSNVASDGNHRAEPGNPRHPSQSKIPLKVTRENHMLRANGERQQGKFAQDVNPTGLVQSYNARLQQG
jgi:hypothetical protein